MTTVMRIILFFVICLKIVYGINWKTTMPDSYYDIMDQYPSTRAPDLLAPKYFDDCTEKFMGDIIIKHFYPSTFRILRNDRFANLLRRRFHAAEAFDLFIVSRKFIGVSNLRERENMVVDVLKKEMPWDIRGLSLIPLSISEYEKPTDNNAINDALKHVAAMKHMKHSLREYGHFNITTTLSIRQHVRLLEDLADRAYGSVGDKNVDVCSGINEDEREMIFKWNDYLDQVIANNDKYFMNRLEEMKKNRSLYHEEMFKKNPMLRKVKALCTLTSEEKRYQSFSDEQKRYRWNLAEDFETVGPTTAHVLSKEYSQERVFA